MKAGGSGGRGLALSCQGAECRPAACRGRGGRGERGTPRLAHSPDWNAGRGAGGVDGRDDRFFAFFYLSRPHAPSVSNPPIKGLQETFTLCSYVCPLMLTLELPVFGHLLWVYFRN